ncbi:MAG: 2-C-methyl-D-erythritol 4-phosphate cytidylyltransferase [Mycobacterium sp.]|nr:2-C-methyl-D-erythritol 4-phosphate cytidylyltransferase [Mycobacterium sp.]
MKLSAILPLPVSAARHPESVFTPVDGEPVLARIVAGLIPEVTEVLVPADAAIYERARAGLAGVSARVIAAGENRSTADCLSAALPHLQASAVTHVLVADHRHPVLSSDLVARVIAALADGAELVVPVLPVTDTVKRVDGQGVIRSTVDRSELKITQYPYGAAVAGLRDLPAMLSASAGVVCVAGDADAIPFDLPADAALLAAVIACRR